MMFLHCPEIICPRSPEVTNGQLEAGTGQGWLDKQIYLCDQGYRRRTSSTVAVCDANGQWTTIPECKYYFSTVLILYYVKISIINMVKTH